MVIIGAGPAGLTAAYELRRKARDWRVTVLEESAEIGGIARTVVHGDLRIDIGGHRFFSRSKTVTDIWTETLPVQGAPARDDRLLGRPGNVAPGGPDPEAVDRVLLRRRRVSRIYYLRHFFDYPISLKPATLAAMGFSRTCKAVVSYLARTIRKRPERSIEDFFVNRFGRFLYATFFEGYTEKLWGVHPSRISPEWGLQRLKGLSPWKALDSAPAPGGGPEGTPPNDAFLYPKLGPGQLWEALASTLRADGVEIRLNAKVVGVKTKDGAVASATLADGTALPCDALFSSMPVKDLVAAMDDVPGDVARIAATLPYRDFITMGLLVDRLAIKNETTRKTVGDIVPDTWIYVQERDVRLGRIQIFNNWSPYMVDDVERHVWIGLEYFCTEGDALWAMGDDEFTEMAIGELRRLGILGADEPVRKSFRVKQRKAYPAYHGSYAEFGKVREWLDRFPNLYCIGRNGQHRYSNMDHSMLNGIAAARALAGEADKAAVWNADTEGRP